MARTLDVAQQITAVQYQEQGSAPSTPSSGYLRTYAKTDGELYSKNDAGTEVCLSELGASDHDNILFAERGSAPSTPASTKWRIYFKADGMYIIDDVGTETLIAASTAAVDNGIVNGRLTLTSGEAIVTSDQTAKTVVYFTPYQGNRIALYNGSDWELKAFTEVSLSLSGLAADTNYDVFIYDNSGVTGELVAWTNATTRATALIDQDGVLVKDGATGRRYVGTIRTTSTIGQCEDSYTNRFVWNYYHRKRKTVRAKTTTDAWTYGTAATWRVWNNDAATFQLDFVVGIDEEPLSIELNMLSNNAAVGAANAFGLDSTSTPVSFRYKYHEASTTNRVTMTSKIQLGTGYHYVVPLEYVVSAVNKTFYGDAGTTYIQTGIEGEWRC